MLKIARKVLVYLAVFALAGVLTLAVNLAVSGPEGVILMYHTVGDPDISRKSLSIPTDKFVKQMDFFYRNHYHVITLDEMMRLMKSKARIPLKTIAITFDDGYESNYTNALPVLKKYHFPATVFMITNYIGATKMIDGKPIKFMTLAELRAMRDSGLITIGSHTKNHTVLVTIKDDPARLKDEIEGSKKVLEDLLGGPVNYFCYPLGTKDKSIVARVRDAGYLAAFTTNPRAGHRTGCFWALKRIKMTETCNDPLTLFMMTSGYYLWLKEMGR